MNTQALQPTLARCLPFFVYIAFLACISGLTAFSAGLESLVDRRWLYAVQISFVLAALAFFRREYSELADTSRLRASEWALLLASAAFGFEHSQWLARMLAGHVVAFGDGPDNFAN